MLRCGRRLVGWLVPAVLREFPYGDERLTTGQIVRRCSER
jgi:hypothetical protein